MGRHSVLVIKEATLALWHPHHLLRLVPARLNHLHERAQAKVWRLLVGLRVVTEGQEGEARTVGAYIVFFCG